MQPITETLWAILQSKLQAGPSGHRARLEVGVASVAGGTTRWEEFSRSAFYPALGPTTSGKRYDWTSRLLNASGDEPLVEVDGANYHVASAGPAAYEQDNHIAAADEWWSALDFDVTVAIDLTSPFITGFIRSFRLHVGDFLGDASLFDGNGAFARIQGGASWQLLIGNASTDHFADLDFDPTDAPVYLRWQHNGTVSRAKCWPQSASEPAWGDPDTVSRADVGDDGITGNLFGYSVVCTATGVGNVAGDLDVKVDYIDPGTTDGSVTEFAWTPYQVISASVDKSYGAESDALSVAIANDAGDFSPLAEAPVVVNDTPVRLFQWYGEDANEVLTFTGLGDQITDHRLPHVVTIRAKDRMKLLLNESIIVTDPQGADEDGSVRTPANFVWLNAQAIDIVNDLLDAAGWPASKRDITDINYTVDEFTAALGDSFAGAIRRVANLVVYEPWVDENEVFQMHPRPSVLTGVSSDDPVEAVASFSGANEVHVIDSGLDDQGLRTRVYVFGPAATAAQETWTEIWHTNVVQSPNGIWHNPDEPTKLWVIDGRTRKVYKIDQATLTRTTLSPALSSNSLAGGMDGDDPDSTSYLWVLETPFRNAADGLPSSSDPCKIRKVRISDWVTVSSHSLGFGTYTAIRATNDYLYVARFDTQKIKKLAKADYSLVDTIDVSAFGSPTGLAINGTELWIFAGGEIHVVDEGAPTVEIDTHPIPGQVGGGEIDSVDPDFMYADFPSLGVTYKYQLLIPGTPAIGGQAIDYTLEDALGARGGVEPRDHVGCPNDADPHPFAIRLEVMTDDKLVSNTQAQDTANRLLARLSRRNRTVQIGVIANPGIQKGDPIEVHDPPSGLDHQLMMVETYTTIQNDNSYLGVISGPLWVTEY